MRTHEVVGLDVPSTASLAGARGDFWLTPLLFALLVSLSPLWGQ